MANRRVFLPVSYSKLDYSLAGDFGEIVFVCEEHLNPFSPDKCIEALMVGLSEENFDPEVDYICMTGQSLILAYTLSAAIFVYGRVNILLFDATTNNYKMRVVSC
jgi:hypothetical protein